MYIILLLLTCLWPAFELPSKVSSLFPHSTQENRKISFTTYQPFGQSYLHTSQLQFPTKIKNYIWSFDLFYMGDLLYSELSTSHWVGIKWTAKAIIKFGISYHELDIIDLDKITTFTNSFNINLKISQS